MPPTTSFKWPSFDRTMQFIMVVAAVILISLLYPNSVKFKYQFQKGQEWRYADLYAPFDFPIKKTEHEIAEGRAALEADITPFYELDDDLAAAKKRIWKQRSTGSTCPPPKERTHFLQEISCLLDFRPKTIG
ncbi:MAG: hypothetical protein R2788_03730 [Saprospiraceae bacterium]